MLSSLKQDFPGGSEVKASASNTGDLGLIPGLGRSPGEENGNPFQYFCLENPMDREAWWATVHGVAKSRTRLRDLTYWEAGASLIVQTVKNLLASGRLRSDRLSGRSPGEGNGYPLHYSYLENSTDRGAWRAT